MRELLEFNRYTHDFTAAMWVCGSILIWLMWKESKRHADSTHITQVLKTLCGKVSLLSIPALVISLFAGGIRAVTFRQYEFVGEITTSLIVALAIKHVFFVVFIIWGIKVHTRARKIGCAENRSEVRIDAQTEHVS